MIATGIYLWLLPLLQPLQALEWANRCYQAGDYRSAASIYDRLAEVGPRNALFYRNRGNLHLLAGDLPQAIFAYHRALRSNPPCRSVDANLQEAYRQAGIEVGRTAWPLTWPIFSPTKLLYPFT